MDGFLRLRGSPGHLFWHLRRVFGRPFWEDFGARKRTWREVQHKSGTNLTPACVFLKKKKEARRDPKIGRKVTQNCHQKERSKVNRKNCDFSIFPSKFHEYIVFYRVEWAPCADFLKFYHEFSRPKRPKNEGECNRNFWKTSIFVLFLE